jgi:predicted DNA-binding protein
MSPRTGRPTDDPKVLNTRVRLSENDIAMLEYCREKTGKKKSEIIREGIRKVYEELK